MNFDNIQSTKKDEFKKMVNQKIEIKAKNDLIQANYDEVKT